MTAQPLAPEPDTDRATLRQARAARLREQLDLAPFDALLLTGAETVDYATGYRSVPGQIHRSHPLAALVTVDRTVLIVSASDAGPAADSGIEVDDIVPFGRFYFAGDSPVAQLSDRNPGIGEALASAIRGTVARRVAVEGLDGLPTPMRSAVIDAVGATAAKSADSWMRSVRAIKLPAEQRLLRRAAEIAEDGIRAAIAAAGPGVTERELAAAVAGAMVAGGGDPRFVVATAGSRSALADAFPTRNACREGDLLRFDVGCQIEGYWSDIARTAVLGSASSLQQSRYDALLAGLHAELELAGPGVAAGAVFDAAVRTVERQGLTPYRRHHAGHAIGLTVYEEPVVRPGEQEVLQPGMVFCLETPYYEIGWGGMMVEDTGVVTDSGFELFTSLDRSLQAVGR
jgi:Xaa-Pro aminopeptidase